jgi:hypothetical protein
MKRIAWMGIVLGLTSTAPALAAERAETAEPVRLDDRQLADVTAGDSLLPLNLDLNLLLQNIAVTVNVSNVPINAGVVVQANAIGQAIQNATVIAGQKVTQAQTFGSFP